MFILISRFSRLIPCSSSSDDSYSPLQVYIVNMKGFNIMLHILHHGFLFLFGFCVMAFRSSGVALSRACRRSRMKANMILKIYDRYILQFVLKRDYTRKFETFNRLCITFSDRYIHLGSRPQRNSSTFSQIMEQTSKSSQLIRKIKTGTGANILTDENMGLMD